MKTIFFLLLSFVSVATFGQAATTKTATTTKPAVASKDCFKEWYTLFKERGANPIPDGTHDVIISIRSGEYSECFMGKVDVTGGKLSSKLQIQKVDGSYEEFDKKVSGIYQNEQGVLKDELRDVTNGMSGALTLSDGESIRLFFYKSLADKPKANKKAPAPSALVK